VRLTVALSPRAALADLRRDIELGLTPKVSIGYRIQERVLHRQASQKNPPTYRVTRWQPFEVSLVDIPADDTVGIGRSAEDPPAQRRAPSRSTTRRNPHQFPRRRPRASKTPP